MPNHNTPPPPPHPFPDIQIGWSDVGPTLARPVLLSVFPAKFKLFLVLAWLESPNCWTLELWNSLPAFLTQNICHRRLFGGDSTKLFYENFHLKLFIDYILFIQTTQTLWCIQFPTHETFLGLNRGTKLFFVAKTQRSYYLQPEINNRNMACKYTLPPTGYRPQADYYWWDVCPSPSLDCFKMDASRNI